MYRSYYTDTLSPNGIMTIARLLAEIYKDRERELIVERWYITYNGRIFVDAADGTRYWWESGELPEDVKRALSKEEYRKFARVLRYSRK
jgi:hypothetical protein